MARHFDKDLQRNLEDPEFAVYFAEAQIESAKELLKVGLVTSLDIASSVSKIIYTKWEVKDE